MGVEEGERRAVPEQSPTAKSLPLLLTAIGWYPCPRLSARLPRSAGDSPRCPPRHLRHTLVSVRGGGAFAAAAAAHARLRLRTAAALQLKHGDGGGGNNVLLAS